eukprot:TRINITY_DN6438_c0_g5_i1.p1 TRINITY_DN6438_c0_g5~~TRINITY_DN6438_c0_g5_i1.p1  ORF type:complete len:402 (-),score=80.67 TRINITY_DN6438_c0_g5_i1:132-1337(-)
MANPYSPSYASPGMRFAPQPYVQSAQPRAPVQMPGIYSGSQVNVAAVGRPMTGSPVMLSQPPHPGVHLAAPSQPVTMRSQQQQVLTQQCRQVAGPQQMVQPVAAATAAVAATRTTAAIAPIAAPVANRPEDYVTLSGPAVPVTNNVATSATRAPSTPDEILVMSVRNHLANKVQEKDDYRRFAYEAFLKDIDRWGLLDGLPLNAEGKLHICLPFCGSLGETFVLLPYLAQKLLTDAPGAPTELTVMGTEIDSHPESFWWPAWKAWTKHEPQLRGRVSLDFRRQDLSVETPPPPAAGLMLGVHPELLKAIAMTQNLPDGGMDVQVKESSLWHDIIANCLKGCAPGGRCIFATFFRAEAFAAKSILASFGLDAVIQENTHYTGIPTETPDTHLRYSVSVVMPH